MPATTLGRSLVALIGVGVCSAAYAAETPAKYVVDYPSAQGFCPPIDGYFNTIDNTIDRAGGRTFRHAANGGYGMPVQDMADGQHLLHLGADVGWYRAGDPIYAVADGVVRVSQGLPPDAKKDKSLGGGLELSWGNLVVIEHKLDSEQFATTIYGHLDTDRLVKVGDIVKAGQQIGTMGTTRVNGGYKPHLHFGVRTGRMLEVGRRLVMLNVGDKKTALSIAKIEGDKVELAGGSDLLPITKITIDHIDFEITNHDGKVEAPTAFAVSLPSPDFPISGYGLSTDGWLDPTEFLRAHGADVTPAPYQAVAPRRKRTRTTAAERREPAGIEKKSE